MKKLGLITLTLLLASAPGWAVRYGVKKQIYTGGTGTNPSYLAYSQISDRMYSGNVGVGNVITMSCADDSLLGVVPGTGMPAPMVYDSVNDRVYYKSGNETFYSIDCASNNLDTSWGGFQGGTLTEYNPIDNKIYLYDDFNDQTIIYNAATYVYSNFLYPWKGPMHHYGPSNSFYVPHAFLDSLGVFSGANEAHIISIYLPGLSSNFNEKMASNPAVNRLYLSMPNTDQVAVVNTATNTLVNTLAVGDNPNSFALCPVNDRMFIACKGSGQYSLKYIDGSDALDSVAVGDSVSTVVYNPADSLIYIGCWQSGYVKLVDPRLPNPAVVDSVPTFYGANFMDMAVDQSGDVYCALYNSDNIYVIGQIPQRVWHTVASGLWSEYWTWDFSDNGGANWNGNAMMLTPDPVKDSLILIEGIHSVNLDVPIMVDQLQVDGYFDQNAMVTVSNGPGDDIVVNGFYSRNMGPLTINPGANIIFNAFSTYNHQMDGDMIPAATWDSLSTLSITGVMFIMPAGMDQAFGNITWDGTQQSGDFTLPGGPGFSAWNIYINSTGPSSVFLTSAAKPELTINNLNVGSNAFAVLGSGGNRKLHVKGDLAIYDPGWLYLTDTLNRGIDTLFLYGDYYHLMAGIGGGGPDSTAIVFCGTDTQSYSANSEILTGYINYQVNPGSILKLPEWNTFGTGSLGDFTLMPGGTLVYSDYQGIYPAGQDSGVIRNLGARNYSQGANYHIYSMSTGPYYTGPGLPDTVKQLTIESFGDQVYINKDLTVMDTLKLLANNLRFDGHRLSLFGPIIQASGNLMGDGTSQLELMGGDPTTLSLPGQFRDVGTLTINRPATVTMTDTLLIYDRLELINGTLDNDFYKLAFLDGAEIYRNANASLTGAGPVPYGFVNVTYGGGVMFAGLELPRGFNSPLGKLTIEGPGDTVTVSDSIAVHDTLTLAGGLVINGDYIFLYKAIDTLKSPGLLSTSPATTIYLMDPGSQAYLPRIDGGHLNIDSTIGAVMGGDVILSGKLKTNTAPLNIGHYTLSLADSVTGLGGLKSDSTSSLVIYGANSGLELPSGIDTLNNLTLDNPNGLGLPWPVNIHGLYTQTRGNLSGSGLSYSSLGGLRYNGTNAVTSGDLEYPAGGGPYSLYIDNPNGVNLHADRQVAGWLQLISGSLITGPNTIQVDSTGQTIAGSGWVDGSLTKYIPAGTPVDTFPVGSADGRSQAVLSFASVSAAGYLNVMASNLTHSQVDSASYCLSRYWAFTNAGGLAFDSCNVELSYLALDFIPSYFEEALHESTMVAGQYDSTANPAWSFPAIGLRNAGATNDGGSIQLTGITGLNSQLTLARDKFYITKLPDTTLPLIASSLPADGATGVGFADSVRITFSEPVRKSLVSYTFLPNPGLVDTVWSADSTEIVFNHSDLAELTSYIVKVSGIEDTAGNLLTGRDSIAFSTMAAPDTIGPYLSFVQPFNGQTGVMLNEPIMIGFSEPADSFSLRFTCTPNPGGWVQTWDSAGYNVFLTHNNFAPGAVYSFRVDSISDINSNPLRTDTTTVPNPWIFTAQPYETLSVAWAGGAYKLFSVPVKPGNNSALANLGDDLGAYSDSTWLMFGYDAAGNSFPARPDIYNGYGYWLASAHNATIDVPGLQQDNYSIVGLQAGWNLIGCPFENPVLVQSIEVIDTLQQMRTYNDTTNNMFLNDNIIRQRMWTYADNSYDLVNNGAWDSLSAFDSASHLQPWQGYAVYALQPCSLFMMPAFKSSAKGSHFIASPKTDINWQAEFSVISGRAADRGIRIGVSPQAKADYDRLDAEKPPLVSSEVTAYIPHEDWNQGPCRAYQYDFRPQADHIEWPLTVRTASSDRPAELAYSLSQTMSEGYQLYLVDRKTNKATVLSGSGQLGFSGSREFAVIYTNRGLGGLALKLLSFDLNQTYPNPFARSITVNYQLAAAGQVSLKVYNVAGQLVRTLTEGTALPGYYSQTWNGRDNGGRKIASGVYFMRLVSGGQERIRKLVKIK